MDISRRLQSPNVQIKIKEIESQFITNVCSDIPNDFWERKQHIVSLPYKSKFDKRTQIPTKACPSQMNSEYLELCKNEIQTLLDINLITRNLHNASHKFEDINLRVNIILSHPDISSIHCPHDPISPVFFFHCQETFKWVPHELSFH